VGGQTGALFVLAAGPLTLDRLRFEGNDAAEEGMQLWLQAGLSDPISVQNVLFADGPTHAMRVSTGAGTVRLGHLTASGHSGAAILLQVASGPVLLDNSILWGNGAPLEPAGVAVVGPTNLVDVDPLFTDAVGGDYSLAAGSPAIDAGDASVAPAPSFDLAHAPRVAGLDADAGAFERGGLFADDFESSDASAWSNAVSN